MRGSEWSEVPCSAPKPVPGPGSQFMSSYVSAYVTLNASLEFGDSVLSRDFCHQLDTPSPIQDPTPRPMLQAPFQFPSPVHCS